MAHAQRRLARHAVELQSVRSSAALEQRVAY